MNLIDRYIVKQFISTLIFGILALCTIFLIVDLIDNLDNFLDQKASILIIIKYYIFFLPEILRMLTPVATLISTLFTVGRLSSLNEIIAMKSGGLSLYRLMMPLVFVATLLSFFMLYFNGWVVPNANENKKLIKERYINKNNSDKSLYNLYLRDTPTRNLIIQFYDSEIMQGNRVTIEDFTSEKHPRITKRIEMNTLTWKPEQKKWIGVNILERNYENNKILTQRYDTSNVDIRLSHDEIEQLSRAPEEMNLDDLKEYISILQLGGKDVRKQLINYYSAWAFPFANIIVILFGVPFASVRRKGGIAIQIGAAMVIVFAYMIFTEVSKTMAFAYNLDPIIAGWSANLIFLFMGIIIIMRTRT